MQNNTTQHTPGPWRYESPEILGETRYVALIRDFSTINAKDPINVAMHEEAMANARLIASAPDLLAALQEIAEMDGDGNWNTSEFHALCTIAKAAIAAATGEASK